MLVSIIKRPLRENSLINQRPYLREGWGQYQRPYLREGWGQYHKIAGKIINPAQQITGKIINLATYVVKIKRYNAKRISRKN